MGAEAQHDTATAFSGTATFDGQQQQRPSATPTPLRPPDLTVLPLAPPV